MTAEGDWIRRIGSASAIVGSVLAAVGNILHPITPRDDEIGVAQVIASSDLWTLIHLIIMLGTLLMLGGLVAVRRSIGGDLPEALADLGLRVATIGVTVGLITVVLDGVTAKQLADTWSMVADSEKSIALAVVSANETANFALAALFNMSFAGVPFLLFGLAIASGGDFPRLLGWIAVAAGIFSMAAGVLQALTGEPTVASLVLTIIGPTVIAGWTLAIGIIMARRANGLAP
jgi:hypothetical protein